MAEREAIGVIGVGWVGLVTAACFAEQGHDVWAMDIDQAKVDSLSAGELTIHEPGLPELVRANSERLNFTSSMADVLANSRLLFCCVDTPPTYSGDADLSRVRAVVGELEADSEHALVMKSTVPAGTGESIRRDLPSLSYVACPEFLKEGSAVEDFLHPDRVVIGSDAGDEWAAEAVADAYRPLGGELVHTDVASAEMIKLASNAFLATKISFINEIANVCEEVGADVTEVSRGMGLDERIGHQFLNAGIGFGGSCFVGTETVLARLHGAPRLLPMSELWNWVSQYGDVVGENALDPHGCLDVWSWIPGEDRPQWMPVSVLTRRNYEGDLVDVRTKMGRRVRVTADHPFVTSDGEDAQLLDCVLARDLTTDSWLPLAMGSAIGESPSRYSLLGVSDDGYYAPADIRVRPEPGEMEVALTAVGTDGQRILSPRRRARAGQGGTMWFTEASAASISLSGATLASKGGRTFAPVSLDIDERFWRVVGLYLAEGCLATGNDGRRSGIVWTFHPSREQHLVDDVVGYWRSQGITAPVNQTLTSVRVDVHSKLLAAWWEHTLGLGPTSYAQRLPDMVWEQSHARKRALLSGLWEGDGSWSLVNRGPSVILEFGTVSDELADGVARLLGDLGIACSWRRGRTRLSTKETHWLRVAGADQIEAADFLIPERDRRDVRASIAAQAKRIKPTGYRSFDGSVNWVRVVKAESEPYSGDVYSLEVPGSHTVVTSGGLVCHQCFPKDVNALKQLAGNSGYHFQLLNSVIEVNELQKRRVLGKLGKHLGSLVGRRIVLLGLAFKPNTDDMREASSLVLAARLQGEGATVVAYDPVAGEAAADMLPAVEMARSAAEALEGADAAVLVTEWAEFSELDWSQVAGSMKQPVVIDGRNFLDPGVLAAAGITYEGIGRGSSAR